MPRGERNVQKIDILLDTAVLGTLFIIAAIWWTVQITKRFYFFQKDKKPFHSIVIYPCCAWQQYPFEGAIKTFVGVVGCAVQGWSSQKFNSGENKTSFDIYIRLLPVYMVVFLSGIMDLLKKKISLSFQRLDWFCLSLVYIILAIVFWNPVGIKTEENLVFSQLLKLLAVMNCLVVLLEARWDSSPILCLARPYFSLVLGSWMWHLGVFVSQEQGTYPTSDTIMSGTEQTIEDSHTQIQLISLFFTWHCIGALLLEMCIWIITIRLAQENLCMSYGVDSVETDICLENRVRFQEIDITAE